MGTAVILTKYRCVCHGGGGLRMILSVSILFTLGPVVLCLAASEEKKSRGVKSLCSLASQNISLGSLGENDYYTAENRDDQTVIYLSLCHPLRNLPASVANLCDPKAFSCITKLNTTTQEQSEQQRNAGWGTSPPQLSSDGGHLQMIFKKGGDCVDNYGKTTGYSTWIDFFCSSDFAADNAIRYEGKFGKCASQVFWHTSLACLADSKETEAQTGSCLLRIPGYDTSLDLSSWASTQGYFLARSSGGEGKERLFQLNLCSPVTGGVCTNDTVICEVDDTEEKLVADLVDKSHKRSLRYNAMSEVITLTYEDMESKTVEIEIKCDKSAEQPEISLVFNEGTKYKFQFLTKAACLVPPVQCTAEDQDGNVFSLSMLAGIEWEIGLEDTTQKYAIKVCGSLPMNSDNPCSGQAGVCTYTEAIGGNRTNPINLGLMRQKPVINSEDDSITMVYEGGDSYTDPILNNTCQRSAEITLMCNDQENGPRVQLVRDPCKHELIWETPAACAQKKAVSRNCTVREPRWSYLFNLTSLYNNTKDHTISLNGSLFTFNVCGDLHSDCSGKDEICFEHEQDLTYDEGTLVMRHKSTHSCPTNPDTNVSASIVFLCEHGQNVSQPRASLLNDGCQLEVEWRTGLACPPHQEVQCSLATTSGLVDLSSLSMPGNNYQIQSEGGGEFSINVCRSLVHSQASHCPYSAAACFTKSVNGTPDSNNLGQLAKGPKFDADGKVYISYKLGSVCLHPNSNRNHIETIIYFECAKDVTESEPQFMEQNLCLYIFHWKHAAACPVKQTVSGNCTVTNPSSGFTFNLTSLRKVGKNYHRKGAYHHNNYNVEFNVCGPLFNSSCPPGSGICSMDKGQAKDMGQANADLTIYDDQLSLVYKSGAVCQEKGNQSRTMETRINFICPPRRQNASGNSEEDAPQLVQKNTQCDTAIEFYTDLACDHQVYCEVAAGDTVYSLTKLRKHLQNYHVTNKEPGEQDFVVNICGPLVPTDVPQSRCNPHGACSLMGSRYQGLGRVQTSPYMGKNGHLVIDYTEGGVCGNRGQQWQTKIIFTCDRSESLDAEHPLGRPEHVRTSDCLTVFKFPTLLACNDTTTDQIVTPDSCRVFHPGTQHYVDIRSLVGDKPYRIEDPDSKNGERYFEIQPCGRVASCSGAICAVHTATNRSVSLGILHDFMYQPALDSVRLRYTNGDECNFKTSKKWTSKIYYTCDLAQDPGVPVVRETFDCLIIFDWRTAAFCPEQPEQETLPPIADITWPLEPPESPHDLPAKAEVPDPKVVGGVSWGMVFLSLLIISAIFTVILLYKKPEARERAIRLVQEARARMPVVLGGRGRDDSTLLVSNGRFGSLADDDDFS